MGQLPPPNTRRWVVRRKAAVVAAVQSGKITLEEACQRYQLTEEEFRSWQRAYEAHHERRAIDLHSERTVNYDAT